MKESHYINNIKCFLIYTVVLGHVLEFNREFALNETVYHIIYTFHMPAFIFLSGVLWRRLNWRKVGSFLVYYLIFQLPVALLRTSQIHYLIPQYHLWFLLSMIAFMLLGHVFYLLPKGYVRLPFIVALLFLSVYSRFLDFDIDTDTLAYQRTLSFVPFFIAGLLLPLERLSALRDKIRHTTKGHSFLVLVASLTALFLYLVLQKDGLDFLFRGSKNYTDGQITYLNLFLTYAVPALIIILLTMLAPNKSGLASRIGRNTFVLFMYHPLFTLTLRRYVNNQFTFSISLFLSILIIAIILYGQKIVILLKKHFTTKIKPRAIS